MIGRTEEIKILNVIIMNNPIPEADEKLIESIHGINERILCFSFFKNFSVVIPGSNLQS